MTIPTPAEVAEALANVFDSRNFLWIVGDVEESGPYDGGSDRHYLSIPMATGYRDGDREFRVALTVQVVPA